MAIYKVSTDVLEECKKVLQSYTNIEGYVKVKNGNLGAFIIKRKKKAEKLIKLLEEEYYV